MASNSTFALDSGLDLREVLTTGSILRINDDYSEADIQAEFLKADTKNIDFIGQPVESFKLLEKDMVAIHPTGFVMKKVLEEGGGLPLHKGCTVHVAFSGYWENEPEPFDVRNIGKPLIVDLNDSGLLPGLQIAIESMLVGELSVFLFSYEVMYGVLGIPPRIKPKANCVFYIKLIKSILTPKEGKIILSEPNMFVRVYREVQLLYGSGVTLHMNKNYVAAIQLFRKAVAMLHKCRLADEDEEKKQEKMLIKLYINLAISNNLIKQPFKVCVACNELNRLNSLWNNGKVLFQNAKALRMIGQFDEAEKRLKRAMKLCPKKKRELDAEYDLLQKTRESCNQSKLIVQNAIKNPVETASDEFKREVDCLIKKFKDTEDLVRLTLPEGLNCAEIDYIKKTCAREKLFLNKIIKEYALDKDKVETNSDDSHNSDAPDRQLFNLLDF